MTRQTDKLNTLIVSIVSATVLMLPVRGIAGAWTLRTGEYYVESYTQYFWNNADFNTSRDRERKANKGQFDEFREEIKAEAGFLSDRLNLLFSLPIKTGHYQDRSENLRTTGVEKIGIGAKYRFTQEPYPVVISGQVFGKFPVCDRNANPPLDDCQTDGDFRLLISSGFLEHPDTKVFRLYANAEFAYRFRSGRPANEIPYLVEVGYNLNNSVWVKGAIDGAESRPFGRGMEEDFTKWTASLLLSQDPSQRVTRAFTVELGYGRVFAGKHTGAAQLTFLKLAYLFGGNN